MKLRISRLSRIWSNKKSKKYHAAVIGTPTNVQLLFSVTFEEQEVQLRSHSTPDSKVHGQLQLVVTPHEMGRNAKAYASAEKFANQIATCIPVVMRPKIKQEVLQMSGRDIREALAMLSNQKVPFESRYTVLREIGTGSTCIVSTARDRVTGQTVVVKLINLTLHAAEDAVSELRMLHECGHHPNIVRFEECFVRCKSLWIVMEHMAGGPLSAVIILTVLAEPQIAAILVEILNALSFLHSKNIVHRDLKSDNILLSLDGSVKLADFGFAIRLEPDERLQALAGTHLWIAPEMLNTNCYDHKADIWALGIVIIEMVDGFPPYHTCEINEALRLIAENGKPALRNPTKLSQELLDFLDKCLQVDPDQRWSAHQLQQHPFLSKAGSLKSLVPNICCTRDFAQLDRNQNS